MASKRPAKRGRKASFATLSDGEASLQIYLRAQDVGEKGYKL